MVPNQCATAPFGAVRSTEGAAKIEMSTDINEELVKQIKSNRKLTLQVDESTIKSRYNEPIGAGV